MNTPLTDGEKNLSGTVFNMQRYCTHDGPGIRTTVFLKGCPLRCAWCHNPESHFPLPEISYSEGSCIHCGHCAAVCPSGCHILKDGAHIFERTGCIRCGACAKACPAALNMVGDRQTVGSVMEEVMKDRLFYGETGGMTLSGGEPFFQSEFALALLKAAKKEGMTTAVETCGQTAYGILRDALEYVDWFLYDYKESSPELFEKNIGVKPDTIRNNLAGLDGDGANIVLRCPVIPGINDRPDHFRGIAETANSLRHIVCVEIEPGHAIGEGKYGQMGYDRKALKIRTPDNDTVREWIRDIQSRTNVPVRRA